MTDKTEVDQLLKQLFPICRSITGDGVRCTLRVLRGLAYFRTYEVPSGTNCFGWTVPDEWNVRDAYIADMNGKRLVDFGENNLHLVSYSEPFEGDLDFSKLLVHLFSLPDQPDAIPYRSSYYQRGWGFCVTSRQWKELANWNATYHVKVDTTLKPGHLTYGEALLGNKGREYLITTYCCHPSMGNDNLSGMVLWALLLKEMQGRNLKNRYRFVIAPETIGSLAYISLHEEEVEQLAGGFVITCVAGPGKIGYKVSWKGDSVIDRVVVRTFRELDLDYKLYRFDVNGSDERQYSSPGLRIPMGTICKDKYYEYPEYHTSLDNLDFISAGSLLQTLDAYLAVIDNLERDEIYIPLHLVGEPKLDTLLGYPVLGGGLLPGKAAMLDAARWVLFYSDGNTSLLDIAERTGLPMSSLVQAAETLVEKRLITQKEKK
jgi:aminopeptidase-like protein